MLKKTIPKEWNNIMIDETSTKCTVNAIENKIIWNDRHYDNYELTK